MKKKKISTTTQPSHRIHWHSNIAEISAHIKTVVICYIVRLFAHIVVLCAIMFISTYIAIAIAIGTRLTMTVCVSVWVYVFGWACIQCVKCLYWFSFLFSSLLSYLRLWEELHSTWDHITVVMAYNILPHHLRVHMYAWCTAQTHAHIHSHIHTRWFTIAHIWDLMEWTRKICKPFESIYKPMLKEKDLLIRRDFVPKGDVCVSEYAENVWRFWSLPRM